MIRIQVARWGLLVSLLLLLAGCEIPESPLYVKGPHFSVVVSGVADDYQGALSMCDLAKGTTPLQFDITAYEDGGAVATTYDRPVNLRLVDVDSANAPTAVSPATSATLVKGRVTVKGITLDPKDLVPNHHYKVQVSDPRRPGVTSFSNPFVMNLERVKFFRVKLTNASLTDYSVSLKVTAYSTQEHPCLYFGGTVDLVLSNGKFASSNSNTVSVTLTSGSYTGNLLLKGPFTIADGTTTPSFTITARYGATQPTSLATGQCLDGGNFTFDDDKNQLDNDTGEETADDKKIDPDGSGAGGGGGGGSAVFAEPASLALTLVPAADLVAVNTATSATATIVKKDSAGTAFTSFSGTITLKEGETTLVSATAFEGLSKALSGLKFATGGVHTLTASLTDDASTLTQTATCTITAAEVGIFGDEATYLKDKFNADTRFPFKFIVVSDLSNLSNLPALIINKAGSGWSAQGGSDLTSAQVDQVAAYYNKGGHVLFGHDTIPTYAVTNFLVKSLGFSSVVSSIDLASLSFTLNTTSPLAGNLTSLTPFNERYTDGYTVSSSSQQAVTITTGGQTYAIVATAVSASNTRAVVMRDLYDVYGGQFSPETQWWETNPDFVVNVIKWLVTGPTS